MRQHVDDRRELEVVEQVLQARLALIEVRVVTQARRESRALDARLPGHDRSHIAYSLSKYALMNITRICALEFAPGVRVNAVAPGLILPPEGKTVSYMEKLKNRVPLRACGTPRDIAEAVLFLVKSAYITGEILYVDGGQRHADYCREWKSPPVF